MAAAAPLPAGVPQKLKGGRWTVVRFFSISCAYSSAWLAVASQLGYLRTLHGRRVLLLLNLAYYVPTVPLLLASAAADAALELRLGPARTLLLRLLVGLFGYSAAALAVPGSLHDLPKLLVLVAALGCAGGIAYSASYQLVSRFANKSVIALGLGCCAAGPLVLALELGLGVGDAPTPAQVWRLYVAVALVALVGAWASISLLLRNWDAIEGGRRGASAAAPEAADAGAPGAALGAGPPNRARTPPGDEASLPATPGAADPPAIPGASVPTLALAATTGPSTPAALRKSGSSPAIAIRSPPSRLAVLADLGRVSLDSEAVFGDSKHTDPLLAGLSTPLDTLLSARSHSQLSPLVPGPVSRVLSWGMGDLLDAGLAGTGEGEEAEEGGEGAGLVAPLWGGSVGDCPSEPLLSGVGEADGSADVEGGLGPGASASDLAYPGGSRPAADSPEPAPISSVYDPGALAGARGGAAGGPRPASPDPRPERSASTSAAPGEAICPGAAGPPAWAEGGAATWQSTALQIRPLLLSMLASTSLALLIFPFFTFVPSSGALGSHLAKTLFFARVFADVAGRMLPRFARAKPSRPRPLLVGVACKFFLAGGFFAYLWAPERLRSDALAVAYVTLFWILGGWINSSSNMLVPTLVPLAERGAAAGIVAIVFQSAHFLGLAAAALIEKVAFGI